MSNVTYDEYLKALEVVNAYHQQIETKSVLIKMEKLLTNVKVGDVVECLSLGNRCTNLTIGKKYEVTRVRTFAKYTVFEIYNDKGLPYMYTTRSAFRKGTVRFRITEW